MTITSLTDILNSKGHFPRSRFTEYFSGADNSAIWTETNVSASSGTWATEDEINGGVRVGVGATSGDQAELDFNNIRPFSPTSSFLVSQWNANNTASLDGKVGFSGGITDDANDSVWSRIEGTVTNFQLRSKDASAGSGTESSIARSTTSLTHTIDLSSADV